MNTILKIIAMAFFIYVFLGPEIKKHYKDLNPVSDKKIEEITKIKDPKLKQETDKYVPEKIEVKQSDSLPFVERKALDFISNLLNSQDGNKILKKIVSDLNHELEDAKLSNVFKDIIIENKSNKSMQKATCGDRIRLFIKDKEDEASNKWDEKEFVIGAGSLPQVYDYLALSLTVSDSLEATFKRNYVGDKEDKKTGSQLETKIVKLVDIHNQKSHYFYRIFAEPRKVNISPPALCGDKVRISYKVTDQENRTVLSVNNSDYQVGSEKFPLIFAVLLEGMKSNESKVALLNFDMLKTVDGKLPKEFQGMKAGFYVVEIGRL